MNEISIKEDFKKTTKMFVAFLSVFTLLHLIIHLIIYTLTHYFPAITTNVVYKMWFRHIPLGITWTISSSLKTLTCYLPVLLVLYIIFKREKSSGKRILYCIFIMPIALVAYFGMACLIEALQISNQIIMNFVYRFFNNGFGRYEYVIMWGLPLLLISGFLTPKKFFPIKKEFCKYTLFLFLGALIPVILTILTALIIDFIRFIRFM